MIPIEKIMNFVSALKDILGDNYSIELKIEKAETHEEPNKEVDLDNLDIKPEIVPDLDNDEEEKEESQ